MKSFLDSLRVFIWSVLYWPTVIFLGSVALSLGACVFLLLVKLTLEVL
jgi:hypothetical protein